MRYIECKECDIRMPPVWQYYDLILDDHMIDDNIVDDENMNDFVKPFVVSHIVPNSIESCPQCKYVFKMEGMASYCLVNHGDNTLCLSCPKCNNYIEKGAIWHKTEWTREDLEDDGRQYKELKNE